MRVLITGGTGFIGSRLAKSELERGNQVTVFGQTNTPAEKENIQKLQADGIIFVNGSVTDRETVFSVIQGHDIVFHRAAAQHEANVPDKYFYDVNVEGTRNVIDACIDSGVKRVIHGSTIGVYGVDYKGIINEDSPLQPDNIYGKTKLEGEQLAISYTDKIPLCVIRISETYGPGDRRLLKLFKTINQQVFFIIGSGKNKHQLIYVDDLAYGLHLAATSEKAIGQVFILAGEEILTTENIIDTICRTVGVSLRKFRPPMWPFVVLAYVLEHSLAPLGIQPPLHRRRLDFFRKSLVFSGEKSRDILGFKPKTSFTDGAKNTLNWYREQKLM